MSQLGSGDLSDASRGLTRRAALHALAIGGASALLAACGSPTPAAAPSATTPPAAAPGAAPTAALAAGQPTAQPVAGQPRRGGQLVSGAVPLARLDAHCFCGGDAALGIWDTVIDYDQNFQPRPKLADSWEANKDITQITLKLHPGIQFHSGRELISEDIKYNFARTMDPTKAPIYSGFVRPFLDAVDTPDKYTAVIKTKQPWPGVWDFLRFLWITDQQADQNSVESDRAAGTGPFKLKEYIQGDHMLLVRNPNYWDSTRPVYLDEVNMRFFADFQALLLAFESGAVNSVFNPPARDLNRYMKDANYTVFRPSTPVYYRGWVAHAQNPPTDNKFFRQALSFAFDRDRVTQTAWLGLGEPHSLPWSTVLAAFDATKDRYYTFDLDRARALIAQSGASNPTIEIEWSTNSQEDPIAAQIWQEDLAKIGVTATLKPLDQPTWFQHYNSTQYRNISMVLSPTLPWNPATALLGPYTKPDGNAAAFQSTEWTDIVKQVQTGVDPVGLKDVYARMNDYLLDQAFHLVWGAQPSGTVTQQNVHDVQVNPFPVGAYNRAWLA